MSVQELLPMAIALSAVMLLLAGLASRGGERRRVQRTIGAAAALGGAALVALSWGTAG